MKREMCGKSPRWKLRLQRDGAETKKTKDCTNPSQFSGDNGERDPPVPIPNTEVKPFSADGTWLETTWESRTLPDSMKKELTPSGVGSFFISSATFLSQVVSNEVRECTWLGYRPPRPVGETGGAISPGRVRSATPFFQIAPTNVQHCTWLGF